MEPELFHLWRVIQDEPDGGVLVVSIVVGIIGLVPIALLVYRRRLHPIGVWAILAAAFFGFSQIFPENRNQVVFLACSAVIGSAVLTFVLVRTVRNEQKKRQQDSDANAN